MEKAEDEIQRLQAEESQSFASARDDEDVKKRKALQLAIAYMHWPACLCAIFVFDARLCNAKKSRGETEALAGCSACAAGEGAPLGEPHQILRGAVARDDHLHLHVFAPCSVHLP